MANKIEITKDLAAKKLHITRHFSAPAHKVWKAWTESELLDKWWAPRPWKAETKSMNFSEGGHWLYAMVGPNNEHSWNRVAFNSIEQGKSFTAVAIFCDEHGNIDENFPHMSWENLFTDTEEGSKVEVTVSFNTEGGMQKIIAMGFEGGFSMALGNLDELLAQ